MLRFDGVHVATVDSRRAGADRWSEIALYRLADGGYVVSKTGFSSVTHTHDCIMVRREMPSWAAASGEKGIPRTACDLCQPDLLEPDPHLRLERTRHRALVAQDADMVVAILVESRGSLPHIILRLLDDAARADPAIRASLDSAALRHP